MAETLIYDIEDLKGNIGPYQTEGFKELTFTIDKVDYLDESCVVVTFKNRKEVVLYFGHYLSGVYIPYRDGLRILMDFDYYRDHDSMSRSMTNDRILFYLTMVGSDE